MGSKNSKVGPRALGETNGLDSFYFGRRGHIYVFSSNKRNPFLSKDQAFFLESPPSPKLLEMDVFLFP